MRFIAYAPNFPFFRLCMRVLVCGSLPQNTSVLTWGKCRYYIMYLNCSTRITSLRFIFMVIIINISLCLILGMSTSFIYHITWSHLVLVAADMCRNNWEVLYLLVGPLSILFSSYNSRIWFVSWTYAVSVQLMVFEYWLQKPWIPEYEKNICDDPGENGFLGSENRSLKLLSQ